LLRTAGKHAPLRFRRNERGNQCRRMGICAGALHGELKQPRQEGQGRTAHARPAAATPVATSENPNGIPPQSPGLRGTTYPGPQSAEHPQSRHIATHRDCGPSVSLGIVPRPSQLCRRASIAKPSVADKQNHRRVPARLLCHCPTRSAPNAAASARRGPG